MHRQSLAPQRFRLCRCGAGFSLAAAEVAGRSVFAAGYAPGRRAHPARDRRPGARGLVRGLRRRWCHLPRAPCRDAARLRRRAGFVSAAADGGGVRPEPRKLGAVLAIASAAAPDRGGLRYVLDQRGGRAATARGGRHHFRSPRTQSRAAGLHCDREPEDLRGVRAALSLQRRHCLQSLPRVAQDTATGDL